MTRPSSRDPDHQTPVPDLPPLKVPPMGPGLAAALDDLQPVRMRRPLRELALFVGLSLPFFAILLVSMGLRRDLSGLPPLWLVSVALVWITSFAATAYLGFVPAKGHVAPRSRNIRQVVPLCFAVLLAVGLLASQSVEGLSTTYEPTLRNVAAHAGGCSILGFSAGILPGLLALLVLRRHVPVGRTAIGLSLGAAGGSLAGLMLLFHCPIAEKFHVGLIHGGAIVTAAILVAGASQILLRRA